ncbi:hypothetical protein PVK06_046974 [Gossypium arboreum]|uniref:Uncharacterized protein n=1 Tax=Gossypium arboreum TaxID=29729 RepID=A0ABR0MC44_GOSAR|nr:hypothetical protein PVK06_046974 [Gossypium arboreum]
MECEDVHLYPARNTRSDIIIGNNPGAFMTDVDPDVVLACEFSEYPDVVATHLLDEEPKAEELFIGQQFVAHDGNRNILPIAFAIVESENFESCEFFLSNLRRHVVKQDNIYLILDRSKGLLAGVMRSRVPWRQRLARIEAQMSSLPKNHRLCQWLGSMEKWQWSQSYDDGFRYGQMTTNLVKAVNLVLRRTHHLPIFVIFLATFYRLTTLMPKMGLRQVKQIEVGHIYVEGVRKAMKVNANKGWRMNTELYSRDLETFRVQEHVNCHSGLPPRLYAVDL